MATIAITRIEPVRTISGNPPQSLQFPEAASQTFLQGAVVVFNSGGFIVEAGANPTGIVGIAAEAGQNLATNGLQESLVWIANGDTIFRANAVFVTAGAAVAASSTPGMSAGAASFVGQMYGLTKLTTGSGINNWVVDLAKQAANRRAIVVNYDPRGQAVAAGTSFPMGSGDTFPVIEFIFFGFFTAFFMTS